MRLDRSVNKLVAAEITDAVCPGRCCLFNLPGNGSLALVRREQVFGPIKLCRPIAICPHYIPRSVGLLLLHAQECTFRREIIARVTCNKNSGDDVANLVGTLHVCDDVAKILEEGVGVHRRRGDEFDRVGSEVRWGWAESEGCVVEETESEVGVNLLIGGKGVGPIEG